jgi:hypothetical protein
MRADGRTDITRIIVAFRNFAKVPRSVNVMTEAELCAKYLNATLFRECC